MCKSEWPFHSQSVVTPQTLEDRGKAGEFSAPKNLVAFIEASNRLVGVAAAHGVGDSTAEIDLRIDSEYRGRGFGTQSLKSLEELVFQRVPQCVRIEGNAREENVCRRQRARREMWGSRICGHQEGLGNGHDYACPS